MGLIWGIVLALIPPLIIVQHVIYLTRVKPRFLDASEFGSARVGVGFKEDLERLVKKSERYFNTFTILLRYLPPFLVLLGLGIVEFLILNPLAPLFSASWGQATNAIVAPPMLEAARVGAIGAYLSVLAYLSRRGFRHDITAGAASWSGVTMAMGPLLAALASRIFGEGSSPSGAQLAVYFLAGFSPQLVWAAIRDLALRSLGRTAAPTSDRTLLLTTVRGMTPEVVERLGEEGIYDVSGLAMADAIRLQRDCNIDKRQLLNWMDEALLIQLAPAYWEALATVGINGAIDLGWFNTPERFDETRNDLAPVARAIDVDLDLLALAAMRIREDAQVRLVWILYQMETSLSLSEAMPNLEGVYEEAKLENENRELRAKLEQCEAKLGRPTPL